MSVETLIAETTTTGTPPAGAVAAPSTPAAATESGRDTVLHDIITKAKASRAPAEAPATPNPATEGGPGEKAAEPAKPTDAPAKPTPKAEDLRRAKAALLLDGTLDDDEITLMQAKDPARFVERGLKAAERQADMARRAHELAELKKQPRGDDGKFAPKPAEKPAPKFDSEPHLKALDQELSAEGRAALRSLVSHLSGTAESLEKRLQERDGVLTSVESALTNTRLERERDGLRERFPHLKDSLSDDAAWGRVRKFADALVQTGEYENLPALMDASVEKVFHKEIVEAAAQKRAETEAMRRDGQPTRPTGSTPRNPTPMTHEQRRDAVLTEILEAKAAGRPLPVV